MISQRCTLEILAMAHPWAKTPVQLARGWTWYERDTTPSPRQRQLLPGQHLEPVHHMPHPRQRSRVPMRNHPHIVAEVVQRLGQPHQALAMDRVAGPDDIGDIMAFLASDDSRWITGQRIEASGGQSL